MPSTFTSSLRRSPDSTATLQSGYFAGGFQFWSSVIGAASFKNVLRQVRAAQLHGPGALGVSLQQKDETRYFGAMVGFTQPFFITPCDGRKLR